MGFEHQLGKPLNRDLHVPETPLNLWFLWPLESYVLMTPVYMESLLPSLNYFALHHLALMVIGHAFYSFEGL